jgi:hypothetical protein
MYRKTYTNMGEWSGYVCGYICILEAIHIFSKCSKHVKGGE